MAWDKAVKDDLKYVCDRNSGMDFNSSSRMEVVVIMERLRVASGGLNKHQTEIELGC